MIPDHANPIRLPPPIGPPEIKVRSCKLHLDCDAADRAAALIQKGRLIHCRGWALPPRTMEGA